MTELNKITEEDFIHYVTKIRKSSITNIAPLGISGEDLIIYENKNKPLRKEFISKEEYDNLPDGDSWGQKGYYDEPVSRSSQLSFRKYGDMCELLITDYKGKFLAYLQLHLALGDEYIGKTYYKIFRYVKPLMNKVVEEVENEIDFENANYSIGWDIVSCYLKEKSNESNCHNRRHY